MFKRRRQSRLNVGATDTFIGEGTIIEGKIVTTASLRIEGHVYGDIECSGDVTIGEKGDVHSIISARNVFTAGKICGAVNAVGKLTITPKGRVEGTIQVGSLHVSEGGILLGSCKMEVPKEKEQPRATGSNHKREEKKAAASAAS